jgi:hypothetical protein
MRVRKLASDLRTLLSSTATPPIGRHAVRLQAVPICPHCGLAVRRVSGGPYGHFWVHAETLAETCHFGRPSSAMRQLARPRYIEADQTTQEA